MPSIHFPGRPIGGDQYVKLIDCHDSIHIATMPSMKPLTRGFAWTLKESPEFVTRGALVRIAQIRKDEIYGWPWARLYLKLLDSSRA